MDHDAAECRKDEWNVRDYYYFCGHMKYATLSVSIMIIIAVLIPGGKLPDVSIGGYDKLIHMLMFLGWALVVQYDFGAAPVSRRMLYFLGGLFFSVLTEVLQFLVEGRSFDMYDMLADTAGLIVGVLIGPTAVRWVKRLLDH